jgi:hypothetical protein
MKSALKTAIEKACGSKCGISDPNVGVRMVDSDFLSDCMIVSDTLNKTWKNQIVALVASHERCDAYMRQNAVAAAAAENPPRTITPEEVPPRPPELFPEELCLNIANALLEGGKARKFNATTLAGATEELRERVFKMDESGGDEMDGLILPGCGRPGFGPDLYQTAFDRMTAAGGSPERAWKNMIVTTVRQNLKDDLNQLRASGGAAGKQMTLENLMLWSNAEGDLFTNMKDAAIGSLDTVKPTASDVAEPLLTYPGMAPVNEPLEALLQEIEAESSTSTPDPFAPPDPSNSNPGGQQAMQAVVEQLITDRQSKYHGAYLGHPDSWAYLQGPVYLTEAVDEERLQYIFSPAPLHTDILKHFPLAPAPLPEQNQDNAYRGFLVPHANWSRKLGDDPGGGPPPEPPDPNATPTCDDGTTEEYKPDYSPEEFDNLVGRLSNTDCVAWQMATVLGFPDKFKSGGELSDEIKAVLEGKSTDFPGEAVLNTEMMENQGPLKPYPTPMHSGISPDSQISTKDGEMKDDKAVEEYVGGWNNLVGGFLETYKKANEKHAAPPFKAWPKEPPDPQLADWAGTVDGETTWSGGYGSEGERQTYQDHVGVQSKGQVYVSTVLKPSINRQRSAFRFSGVGEFTRFLVSSCGRVGGTYFIDEQAEPAVMDVAVINSALDTAGCEGTGTSASTLNLRGFAYLSFPKALEIKGKIAALGPGDDPTTGRLVLLANGVKMSGGTPEVTGMVLSNGHFQVEEGNEATITGTLVTTGTLTLGIQDVSEAVQDAMGAGNDGEVVPLDRAHELLGKEVGKLQPLTIEKLTGSSYDRTQELKLIFSPFRVSQDFEVRRQ